MLQDFKRRTHGLAEEGPWERGGVPEWVRRQKGMGGQPVLWFLYKACKQAEDWLV